MAKHAQVQPSVSKLQPQNLIFFFLLFQFVSFILGADESRRYHYHSCGTTGNFTSGSTYSDNLATLLGSVSSGNSIMYGFSNTSSGQGPDRVNMIVLCRGDVALRDCRACVNDSSLQIVRRCPAEKEAVIWYEICMLRYSNRTIYGVMETSPAFYIAGENNTASVTEFNNALRGLLNGLTTRAAAGSSTLKFAVGNTPGPDFETLYGLVQCTPDISEQLCNDCLVGTIEHIPTFNYGKTGGRWHNPSCNMRYEIYLFYNDSSPEALPPSTPSIPLPTPTVKGTSGRTSRVVTVVVVSIVSVGLLFGALYMCIQKVRKPTANVETVDDEIRNVESLHYDFATVRTATDNFSEENKLGQGGFGAVYKGKLADGQEIAVKRLSRGLGQGDQEFKTEVLLVAKLQHRNLVRLLGFCLSGDERLLIYEFVLNSSLDRFIFDPVRREQMDWEKRQKIIGGIARGMVYLHEDSRLRIIHRDLKASNVLLDADMIPKIADFGMARLCTLDATHVSTDRIVGTYGYMAPEYALYGKFSLKSDVFSFGVLVLEIVTGQRNNGFQNGESTSVEDFLSLVWRSWRDRSVANIIDPLLREGSRTQMLRCIHIGLLCAQENAANRPNMTSVLMMLNSTSISLPLTSRPALYMSNTEPTVSSLRINNSEQTASINEVSITDMVPR